MLKIVVVLLCAIATTAADLLTVINRGIVVDILPSGEFKIGFATIPVNTLCKTSFITERLACHICAVDCSTVHDRYGGQCGTYESKDDICLCGDTLPDGGVPTPAEQCGSLTFDDLIGLPGVSEIDQLLLGAFDTVVIVRQDALLCPFKGNGCDVDCYENHQYNNGECDTALAVPQENGDSYGSSQVFCLCDY